MQHHVHQDLSNIIVTLDQQMVQLIKSTPKSTSESTLTTIPHEKQDEQNDSQSKNNNKTKKENQENGGIAVTGWYFNQYFKLHV